MPDTRLRKARDLVTTTDYAEVDGKRVAVATRYSSASLGVSERVEHSEPKARRNESASRATEKKE